MPPSLSNGAPGGRRAILAELSARNWCARISSAPLECAPAAAPFRVTRLRSLRISCAMEHRAPEIATVKQLASARARQFNLPYAGALLPREAHRLMQAGARR